MNRKGERNERSFVAIPLFCLFRTFCLSAFCCACPTPPHGAAIRCHGHTPGRCAGLFAVVGFDPANSWRSSTETILQSGSTQQEKKREDDEEKKDAQPRARSPSLTALAAACDSCHLPSCSRTSHHGLEGQALASPKGAGSPTVPGAQ